MLCFMHVYAHVPIHVYTHACTQVHTHVFTHVHTRGSGAYGSVFLAREGGPNPSIAAAKVILIIAPEHFSR